MGPQAMFGKEGISIWRESSLWEFYCTYINFNLLLFRVTHTKNIT